MIVQVKSALSNLGGSIKAVSGSHPVVTGIILGIVAYYVVSSYWMKTEEGATEEGSTKG